MELNRPCAMASFSLVKRPIFRDLDFPEARTGSCVAIVNHFIYFWGGHTQFLVESAPVEDILPNSDDNFIDVYDINHNTWQQYPTTGDVPDLGNGSTFTAFLHNVFLFGGWNEGDFSSDVYCFNTIDKSWEFIALSDDTIKPSPRYLTGAVLFWDEECDSTKLCIFGGVGAPIQSVQKGAEYIEYRSHSRDFGFGWNNEMFYYDIQGKAWCVPELVGERPPACGGFSFNKIDPHRALLFGGRQQHKRVASVYIFDFIASQWSSVYSQATPSDPWPSGRTFHTSCCLVDPIHICYHDESKFWSPSQRLFVMWGKGDDNKHCEDCWILDVKLMKWKEVKVGLRPRMWHMACSCYVDDGQTDVLLFGGNKHRDSGTERHVMAELTIFSFGLLSLKQICLECIRKNYSSLKDVLHKYPVFIIQLVKDYISGYNVIE